MSTKNNTNVPASEPLYHWLVHWHSIQDLGWMMAPAHHDFALAPEDVPRQNPLAHEASQRPQDFVRPNQGEERLKTMTAGGKSASKSLMALTSEFPESGSKLQDSFPADAFSQRQNASTDPKNISHNQTHEYSAPLCSWIPVETLYQHSAQWCFFKRSEDETQRALKTLYKEMENFSACPLKETALNTVCFDGFYGADLMLIGEAPGAEEDKSGKPFVGASGKLLDKMLSAIGHHRGNTYITNVVLWRPPFNRQPSKEEIDVCLPLLHRHIAVVCPKVLVTLGAVAYKALFPDTPLSLTQAHGKASHYSYAPDPSLGGDGHDCCIPVFPLYHPAYLLRSPDKKGLAWAQLQQVEKCLKHIKGDLLAL